MVSRGPARNRATRERSGQHHTANKYRPTNKQPENMRCTDTTPTEALMNKAQERLRTTGRSIVDFDMMAGMIVTNRQTRKGDTYELFEITDQHPHTVYLGHVEKTFLQTHI